MRITRGMMFVAVASLSVLGCSSRATQFADAELASRQGQCIIVGQVDPTSHIERIDVVQDGWDVATVDVGAHGQADRHFSVSVWPGSAELRAYVGTVILAADEQARRELAVDGTFMCRVDLPADSVTYIGQLYDVSMGLPTDTVADDAEATGATRRVFVKARDNWANAGGAQVYLQQFQPDVASRFARVLTQVCPTWVAQ